MTPTLIVTRPEAQGMGFAQTVARAWGRRLKIVRSPLIAIRFLQIKDDLAGALNLIFTSANGVTAAVNAGLGPGLHAWCVGSKTASLAAEAGFQTATGSGDAAGLVELILDQHPDGQFAHLRGTHSRGDVSARLRRASIPCHDVIAYDQLAQPLTAEAQNLLNRADPILCPLFSPRTATILGEQGPFVAPLDIIAISEAVADAAQTMTPRTVTIATSPDEEAMIAATLAQLHQLSHDDD